MALKFLLKRKCLDCCENDRRRSTVPQTRLYVRSLADEIQQEAAATLLNCAASRMQMHCAQHRVDCSLTRHSDLPNT